MSQWLPNVKFGSGKDGSPDAISGVVNTYASCTGTAAATSLTTTLSATLGDVILIHQSQGTGAGQWELNYVNADAGATLTLALPLAYTYTTGAQVVLVKQYTGGDISGTVTGTAWAGSSGGIIALMSNGSLTVSGSITAKGIGFRGGQSVSGANKTGYQGESSLGVGIQSTLKNGSASGGGNQSSGDDSGASGSSYGTSGISVGNSQVGDTQGIADLTTIFQGAGAGSGGTEGDGAAVSGAGGIGGGIIFMFSKQLIVTGTINCNGNNGSSTSSPESSGGGGATGGSILIYSQLPIIGTNKITATGGAGGSAGAGGQAGGTGGNGRIRINYYSSVSGTSNPTLSSAQNTNLQSFIYSGMI